MNPSSQIDAPSLGTPEAKAAFSEIAALFEKAHAIAGALPHIQMDGALMPPVSINAHIGLYENGNDHHQCALIICARGDQRAQAILKQLDEIPEDAFRNIMMNAIQRRMERKTSSEHKD
jgi:hypothetical protein